jgi:hypothetical protein
MAGQDKYLVLLRRELTRSQARLARAERERDRLLEQNRALRERLALHGVASPAKRPASK